MRIRHGRIQALIIPAMGYRHYSRDNLADVLRAHGINPTHQRIEIAHALYSRQEHPSADQVLAIVNGRHPKAPGRPSTTPSIYSSRRSWSAR